MTKLKTLNLGMNRLCTLPRGFGAFPVLEVLYLTYNYLNETSLPQNFFQLDSLRALYLGDNDFETLPPKIGRLKNLQICCPSRRISKLSSLGLRTNPMSDGFNSDVRICANSDRSRVRAPARVLALKAMDPGFKPVSYHLASKGRIPVAKLSHTRTRTKQPSLTYHTEHSPY
ncbi:hypothetical protein DPMN_077827 [Dreissena polymorpha]|uniref:Uncharacterized protein n=1 Tax=Dreissena polymorpha TaxID=45954 RepID=A0A9D3YMP5_DREPO|nr:hypothetical protein DPMN_077827 [Dreissena polymorpha]